MAENEQEGAEAPAKGGASFIMVLLAALLSAAGAAGGTWFLVGRAPEPAVEAEAAAEEAEPEEPAAAAFRDRVYALDPFVVNVSGEGYPRYLKLKVELEADSPEAREELEARVAQVRDATILLLSSKRLADLADFEGKALLKDDLRDRVNGVLEEGSVESVLFTEFVVQ